MDNLSKSASHMIDTGKYKSPESFSAKSKALSSKKGMHAHECKNCGIKISDERPCKSSSGEAKKIIHEEKEVRKVK